MSRSRRKPAVKKPPQKTTRQPPRPPLRPPQYPPGYVPLTMHNPDILRQ